MGIYYHRPDTALLERSVRSVTEQTTRDWELLICDDGSSADATALLDHLSQQDNRIRLIRPGNVYSLPRKLNVCLQAARGLWIGRMDDDDYAHPDRLEKQMSYLEQHPDIAFVGCNVNLVRGGQPAGQWMFPEFPTVEDFFWRQPYIHPAMLFRRKALETVGGYSEGEHQILCEDYDLLLRLYENKFQGANLQEFLLDYTLPETAKGNRRMRHRWNEAITRFQRFRALGKLPKALPYVIKPVITGLLPERILKKLKEY